MLGSCNTAGQCPWTLKIPRNSGHKMSRKKFYCPDKNQNVQKNNSCLYAFE